MQPNTTHKVFTLRECVAAGGHFYSLDHLERTLVGRLREHYFGTTVVNSFQPTAQTMIIGLGRWLHRLLAEEERCPSPSLNGSAERFHPLVPMSKSDTAALIFMLLEPQLMEPPLELDAGKVKKDEQGRRMYTYPVLSEFRALGVETGLKLLKSIDRDDLTQAVLDWGSRNISQGFSYSEEPEDKAKGRGKGSESEDETESGDDRDDIEVDTEGSEDMDLSDD